MRIGVDATCWWNHRGFGRFTRQILTAMLADTRGHEFCLFVDQDPAPEMLQLGVDIVRVRTSKALTAAATADSRRRLTDLLAFRQAVSDEPLDVMYFPAVYSWFPTSGRVPSVITFHDAIAEHYSDLVFPNRLGRLFWTIKTWLARRSAAGFTTVSEAARDEVATFLNIPRENIYVILEAASPIFKPIADPERLLATRVRLGLPIESRLLIYVGGLAPHKNLLRLIDAYAKALQQMTVSDMVLVFIGDPKGDGFYSNFDAIKARVESDAQLAGRVYFAGFVSDDDLVALYSDAYVVAMPALSEGFGLPAAEAIACGTPVIASRGGAVAEVVSKAGLFFNPLDVADMADVIVRAASDADLYATLRQACAPRSAELSWSVAAAATLDVLERFGAAH